MEYDPMIELQERLRDVLHQIAHPEVTGLGDTSRELRVLRQQVDDVARSVAQLAIIVQGLRNPT